MGADGYIPQPERPLQVHITCYYCSKPVKQFRPVEGHRDCLRGGQLFVMFEQENYEAR